MIKKILKFNGIFMICLMLPISCASGPENFVPQEFKKLEKMSDQTLSRILSDVEAQIRLADFKRAGAILSSTDNWRMNHQQKQTIRALNTRLRKLSFLHHHPIELCIIPSKTTYAFGDEVTIDYTIQNLSDQELIIPGSGGDSWLPWGDKRTSCIQAEVDIIDIDEKEGVFNSNRSTVLLEYESPQTIPSGAKGALTLNLSPLAPGNALYRRIRLSGELIPGGLQTGRFDWGMIRLNFQPTTIHFLKTKDLPIAADPGSFFKKAVKDQDGRRLLLSSVLMNHESPWPLVDKIISIAPSCERNIRHGLLGVLEWMTGQQGFGTNLNKWMDWWNIQRKDKLQDKTVSGPSLKWGFLAPCLICALKEKRDLSERVQETLWEEKRTEALRNDLNHSYYLRRNAAHKKLLTLAMDAPDVLKRLLGDPLPRIRCAAAFTLGQSPGFKNRYGVLMNALKEEKLLEVKRTIIKALAAIPPKGESSAFYHKSKDPGVAFGLRDFYIKETVLKLLSESLHFGRIPGFYDGQFRALWDISEDVFFYIAKIAMDPDVAYHLRVMAIMSLHEQKDKDLRKILVPLIIDPDREIRIEWEEWTAFPLDEDIILKSRKRSLSKYARFSLAKAGIIKYNLDQIEAMRLWIEKNRKALYRRSRPDGKGGKIWDPNKLFCKSLVLDMGYHYQQYDNYKDAERWYQVITKGFPKDEDAGILAEAHYNLACLYSMTQRKDEAIEQLQLSVKKGFTDFSWMDKDKDLDNIRAMPAYHALRADLVNPKGSPDQKVKKIKK